MKLPHLKIALVGIIATAVLMAGFVVVQANGNEKAIYIENVETLNVGGLTTPQLGSNDPILGGINTTTYDSLELTDALWVTGEAYFADDVNLSNTTTTIDEISYGSRFSKALTFSAGATTTAGGLVALQNGNADQVCRRLEARVTGLTDTFVFRFATSTSATVWVAGDPTIIASSTVATSTTVVLNDVDHVGTSKMDSWVWSAGHYLLGSFDSDGQSAGASDSASTTAYSAASGKLYVTCHTL